MNSFKETIFCNLLNLPYNMSIRKTSWILDGEKWFFVRILGIKIQNTHIKYLIVH